MEPALHLHRSRQSRVQEFCHATKIMACGGMIGAAILFPLANAEGFRFRAVTLSIFVLTTVGFHALHLEPFVRFGPFTGAVALVLLLVAVLSTGSSRKELIPWLPLFIASSSLVTVAIHRVSQQIKAHPPSVPAEDEFSGVSIDTWSDHSLRTASGPQQEPRPFMESTRFDSLYFACHGPSSRCSHRTGTELSLSSVVGQCRPHWDAHTQNYFAVPPEQDSTEAHAGSSQGQEDSLDPDSDSDTEYGNVEPSHPLLGVQ